MYNHIENQLSLDEFDYPIGKLKADNRWIVLSKLIPWEAIEKKYREHFGKKGNVAKSSRIALGSLIIKTIYNCSDEDVTHHVEENPYLQYFLGMKKYEINTCPFSKQSMSEFRKRFSDLEVLNAINGIIIEKVDLIEEKKTGTKNSGELVIDATCIPADITYPQDTKLLNRCREETEKIIDEVCETNKIKKPRMKRKLARQDYLNFSKSKKRGAKQTRKAIKKQLSYIRRNLSFIEKYIEAEYDLKKYEKDLKKIQRIYEQQNTMIIENKRSTPDRIVSYQQDYVRPIVRGKAHCKTEFGPKLEISVELGFTRIETFSFDPFNEGKNLQSIVEKFKSRTGYYPEKVLVDKIYRNRENLIFCRNNGISITGPLLGRPKKDAVVDKKEEYEDICKRNCVEGKIGEVKGRYGLDRLFARTKLTTVSQIGVAIIVTNLMKGLRLLFSIFIMILFKNTKPSKISFSTFC